MEEIVSRVLRRMGRNADGKRYGAMPMVKTSPQTLSLASPAASSPSASSTAASSSIAHAIPDFSMMGLPMPPPDPRTGSSCTMRPLSVRLKNVPHKPPGRF